MPIHPLPQFEADLKAQQEEDRKVYEALKAPKTLVVRFGCMKLVGEFPYDGSAKPGCGSRMVVRTQRGTEIGEMLTSTCPNSGCSKSVSRKQMLDYIDNSGGRDYPFFTEGRVLRVATQEDMDKQAKIEQSKHGLKMEARKHAEALGLPIKVVDAEPLLGGERVTFYFASEDRVDFRDLVRVLQQDLHTRIEMRQVGARDEARLTADYERCGQYCCCKNFLKVLKPISMKAAKTQKATLDPLKISGRCGRLMCCLRYEEQTYDDLRARLPRKKSRVGTPEGDGWVVDTQILTQLVLVQLEREDRQVAIPVENLSEPGGPPPAPGELAPPPQGGPRGAPGDRPRGGGPGGGGGPDRGRGPGSRPAGPPPQPGQPRPDRRNDRRDDRRGDRPPGPPRMDRSDEGGRPPSAPMQEMRDRPPQPPASPEIDEFDDGPEPGAESAGPVNEQGGGAGQPGQAGAPQGDRNRRRRRKRRRGGGGGPFPGGGQRPGGGPPRQPPPPFSG